MTISIEDLVKLSQNKGEFIVAMVSYLSTIVEADTVTCHHAIKTDIEELLRLGNQAIEDEKRDLIDYLIRNSDAHQVSALKKLMALNKIILQ